MPKDTERSFAVFMAVVFLLKAVGAILDPVPKFFFGDSYSYLYTAAEGWVPPDRSFTYGFFIRLTTLLGESLMPLMAVQWTASAANAVLLAYTLRRYFDVRPAIAYLFGILCALEPIQMLYERHVMTETLSLFFLILYLWAVMAYLAKTRLRTLVLLQLVGTALISLRISFLPIVLLNAVMVPLMGIGSDPSGRSARKSSTSLVGCTASRPRSPFLIGLHLLVSVLVTFCLHTGYKYLFSTLSGHPPGYHAASGHFLLAAWAPVVEPEDFPRAELRGQIFDQLPYNLKDRALRNDQLFSDDGLIARIHNALPDPEGDRAASATAMNALTRDPLGIAALGFQTFGDFFDTRVLREKIMNDLALDQVFEYKRFVEDFGGRYGMLESEPQPFTFTKGYYQDAIPWYWFLLLTPVLWACAILAAQGESRGCAFILLIASLCCIGVATVLSVMPIVRYLHPVSWLALCAVGVLCEKAVRPSRRGVGRGEGSRDRD